MNTAQKIVVVLTLALMVFIYVWGTQTAETTYPGRLGIELQIPYLSNEEILRWEVAVGMVGLAAFVLFKEKKTGKRNK